MNKKNKLNKIIEEKKANSLNKKLRYGLRKLSIGVVSCLLGYAIALTPNLSYANTEPNTVVASNQTEKTTKDESKTTQKENKDMLQGKNVAPVGQLDRSDLTKNKVTEKSTIQKANIVNPVEKTEDKVEKMNTQYTVTYGPGLAYVGEGTTVNISFKQKNSKVNVPAGTTFELAGNSANGASVDKNTGKIRYTPDSTVLKDGEKEKNVTVNVKITYKDQSTSTITATITVRKEESAVPKINPVVEGQTKITGTGVKGAKIEVEIEKKVNDGETAGVTTVKDDGTWEVVVEKDSLKKDYKVVVTQTEKNKTPTSLKTFVAAKQESEKDKQQPDAGTQKPQDDGQSNQQEKSATPTVNPVTEGDTTISGTGKAGAKIHVTKVEGNSPQGLIMGEDIVVNNDGKWTLNVPQGKDLKKGDAVLVVQQEDGKSISDQVSSVVAEKKVDKQTEQTQAPTLNKINEKSTTISGTGKAGAKIFLKKTNAKTPQGIDLAKNIEVDSQGNWTYTVKAGELQVGDTIFAYQKEENKLISYEAHEEVTKAEVKKPEQDNQGNKKNPDPNQKPQQDPPSDDEKEAREKEEAAKLTIKDAYAGDKTLSGTAAKGYKVSIIIELKNEQGKVINKDATVDEHGNWSANLVDELKEGDKVTVYQTKQFKNGEKTITVKAKQEKPQNPAEDKVKPNPPAKEDESKKEKTKNPIINPVKEGDKVISGKGVPGAKVNISKTGKNYSKNDNLAQNIVVDERGNWSVAIDSAKKFKAGDIILAVQKEDGKENSDITEVTVVKADNQSKQQEDNKKPNPPAKEDESRTEKTKNPTINPVKEGDKVISGTGVPGAKVSISRTEKDSSKGIILAKDIIVDKKGNWSVTIDAKKFKEGDIIFAVQREDGKEYSDQSEVTVAKADKKSQQPEKNKKPENNNQDNQEKELSKFPVANEIKVGDTKITGQGVPDATIVVTKQGENAKEVKATVGKDGKWSVDLKEAAKEGDEFIIQQQEKGKKDSPRISKVTQKSDKKQNPEKKPEGEKKPENNKKPETKTPEIKKPDVKKPEGEKKPGDTKKPEDNKKPEAEKKPEGDKKPGDNKKTENNKKPDKKAPEQKPEVKNPGKTTNPSNNRKQPEKTPDVKKPETKTPEMKRPEKNAKKPSAQNKKSMNGISLHYEIKTVKKGAKIKVTPVFKDKSGKIIKMPQGVMFSLDKNSPKGVKIDPKTGELSVDTTGYKNGDKIVVTVVATIKGSTTKVYSLFAKDGKTTQPNEPTKTTEQDTVIKTKVEINIEKSEKNKTNKNNKKASNKKKLPKAGYENEIISLAIASITTLGGAYITNKKKK